MSLVLYCKTCKIPFYDGVHESEKRGILAAKHSEGSKITHELEFVTPERVGQ